MFGDDPYDLPGERVSPEKFLPYVFNGDLYEVYHRDGKITRVYVNYDRMAAHATQVDLDTLTPEILHKLEDRINLNK